MAIYGEKFFSFMATCEANYRKLGECIAEVLEIGPGDRVVDFGCGLGFVLDVLQEHGASVLGIDAFGGTSEATKARGRPSRFDILAHDLAAPAYLVDFTIAICTETGEHLPEGAADTLVASVAGACTGEEGRGTILWSAAPPGQDADDPGHINLQPAEFWLSRFAALGWVPDPARTARLRAMMRERHAQHEYCADNFTILVRP